MGEKGQSSSTPIGGAVAGAGANPPQAAGLGGTLAAAVGNVGGGATPQGAGGISGLMSQVAAADPATAGAATAGTNAQGSGEKGQAQDSLSELSPEQQLRLQQAEDARAKASEMLSNAEKKANDVAAGITGSMK